MSLTFTELGFAPDYVNYLAGWNHQRRLHDEVVRGVTGDTVLLLEHEAVYTAGKRTEPWERPADGTPVIDVDRGGKITWHGPGQLVGYPIIKLADPTAVRKYVESLEAALIEVCAEYGIVGDRVEGRSGVWLEPTDTKPSRKIGAIGIRVDHGVTMHGFALNCSNSLDGYSTIVPCGIADAGVTSIAAETGTNVSPYDTLALVRKRLVHHLAPAIEEISA
ncbi:lipoyl(octanoyl) transferase LipB [Saxibacter everestensis]|uniref:Octanoyltransferase n=1 Tax=Saxibacter everestensis TaxID=2909229 RepID=A0ABY8QWS9_9MICO|nr:lipoyl(octanoyl) transferase LipB [Brevibacteriaceae bacterium ZFBP1038]